MCGGFPPYKDDYTRIFTSHKATREQRTPFMETSTLPTLLKISEIMDRTGLSKASVYRVINAGQLRTVKIGRSVRVTESELSRYIEALEK